MTDTPKCELCGEPMPAGEEMFKYHGYSGPCPKPAIGASREGTPLPSTTKDEVMPSESGVSAREYSRPLPGVSAVPEGRDSVNNAHALGEGTPSREALKRALEDCEQRLGELYAAAEPFIRPFTLITSAHVERLRDAMEASYGRALGTSPQQQEGK